MLVEGKNAIIYGGAGSIGGAAARALAREGATVFLAGRTLSALDAVADEIRSTGGRAETAEVDALDERSVTEHADAVATTAGSIDISMNVIQHGDVQGIPMVEMDVEDYLAPVVNGVRTNFLTIKAAAPHMKRQRSGVVLFFGGHGDPLRGYSLGGLQTGFDALEAMRRQASAELGEYGIRFVSLRSAGVPVPESISLQEPPELAGAMDAIAAATMLGRAATLEDVGNAVAFAASDHARAMTAATINISAGTLID